MAFPADISMEEEKLAHLALAVTTHIVAQMASRHYDKLELWSMKMAKTFNFVNRVKIFFSSKARLLKNFQDRTISRATKFGATAT